MKSSNNSLKFQNQYKKICVLKNIEFCDNGFAKYQDACERIYHVVCFDIIDTVTNGAKSDTIDFLKALCELTQRHVIICFLTSRGSRFALEYLNNLREKVMEISDDLIKPSDFDRWYCIVDNGYTLYCNDYMLSDGFLKLKKELIDRKLQKAFSDSKEKDALRNIISSFLSKKLYLNEKEIIEHSSKTSFNRLRFPLPFEQFDDKINEEILSEILEISNSFIKEQCNNKDSKWYHLWQDAFESTTKPYLLKVYKGVYKDKEKYVVVDVVPTCKEEAINKLANILGIRSCHILRVGDQGNLFGNDYEMLACDSGFSVKSFSNTENCCYPVCSGSKVLTGVQATSYIVNNFRIYPTVCLQNPQKDDYISKLAQKEYTSILANRETIVDYSQLIKSAFLEEYQPFTDVWEYMDVNLGGFVIKDWEYMLLKARTPHHLLFKIFDKKAVERQKEEIKNKHKYLRVRLNFATMVDNGMLLRGPLNYYYGLCFRNEDRSNLNKQFLLSLIERRVNFMKISASELQKNLRMDLKNSINRRVILGILDSIRDYFLFILNVYLQEASGNNDILYLSNSRGKNKIDEIYTMLKCVLKDMYTCLFGQTDTAFVSRIATFIEAKVIPLMNDNHNHVKILSDDYNYDKGCRVWREIDSFFENVVAVDTAIRNMIYDRDLSNKTLMLYGIRYGSLELPVIAAMLLETKYKYFDIKYQVGALCLSTTYEENHSENKSTINTLQIHSNKNVNSGSFLHILMDDNLVTGRTLQKALNMLVYKKIHPYKLVVVRYPSLNRISHMFLPSHGAPDTDLFWTLILGLTSPAPYTRLYRPGSYELKPTDNYLDELGEFNKTRSFASRMLYRNGIYSEESSIAKVIEGGKKYE